MSVRKFAAAGVLGCGLAAMLGLGGCARSAHPGTPANENFVQPASAQQTPALMGGPGSPPAGQAMQATPAPAPGAPVSAHPLPNNDGERG